MLALVLGGLLAVYLTGMVGICLFAYLCKERPIKPVIPRKPPGSYVKFSMFLNSMNGIMSSLITIGIIGGLIKLGLPWFVAMGIYFLLIMPGAIRLDQERSDKNNIVESKFLKTDSTEYLNRYMPKA